MVRFVVFICLLVAGGPALAVYPDPVTRGGLVDEDAAEAERLIDQERFDVALPMLESVVTRYPDNADVHNALGYTLRKLGRLDDSYRHYRRALALDPAHRAAHEYLGELFLMRNEVDRAKEQLRILIGLCPDGCEERAELEDALRRHAATVR